MYYAPNITNPKSSWYTVLTTKSRQVNENVASKERVTSFDDALQNDTSNASSSHVERVIIREPSNFFIYLRMFENDFSNHEYNEEKEKEKDDDEARSIHEESDSDHDDLT